MEDGVEEWRERVGGEGVRGDEGKRVPRKRDRVRETGKDRVGGAGGRKGGGLSDK